MKHTRIAAASALLIFFATASAENAASPPPAAPGSIIDLTQSSAGPTSLMMPNWHRRPYPDNNWPRIIASGKAAVSFVVATDGSVADIRVFVSSGRETFDSAFATFIAKQQFSPATLDGKPVAVRLRAEVDMSVEFGKVSIFGYDRGYDQCLSPNPQVSIPACTNIIAAGCTCGIIRLIRARAYAALGRDEEALADLDAATKPDHQDGVLSNLHGGELSRLRGFIYERRGDYQKAIDGYSDAMDLKPVSAVATMDRGFAYQALGRADRAAADFKTASELAQDCGKPDCKADGAARIAVLDQRIAQNPDDIGAFANRCVQRSVSGHELSMALADCNHVQARVAGEPNTLEARGLIFLRRDQLADAMQDFNAALAAEPKRATSIYLRGVTEQRSGQTAAAHADFVAARNIDSAVAVRMAIAGILPA